MGFLILLRSYLFLSPWVPSTFCLLKNLQQELRKRANEREGCGKRTQLTVIDVVWTWNGKFLRNILFWYVDSCYLIMQFINFGIKTFRLIVQNSCILLPLSMFPAIKSRCNWNIESALIILSEVDIRFFVLWI